MIWDLTFWYNNNNNYYYYYYKSCCNRKRLHGHWCISADSRWVNFFCRATNWVVLQTLLGKLQVSSFFFFLWIGEHVINVYFLLTLDSQRGHTVIPISLTSTSALSCPTTSFPRYLLFKRPLTTFRAALGYAACVSVLKQHKCSDTLFLTAMSIELQSGLPQWGQSTRIQWRRNIWLVGGSYRGPSRLIKAILIFFQSLLVFLYSNKYKNILQFSTNKIFGLIFRDTK